MMPKTERWQRMRRAILEGWWRYPFPFLWVWAQRQRASEQELGDGE